MENKPTTLLWSILNGVLDVKKDDRDLERIVNSRLRKIAKEKAKNQVSASSCSNNCELFRRRICKTIEMKLVGEHMIKKKKAVVYVRVSDIKQLDGVSLGHQEDKTTKYMELDDYEVVMVFREEGRSAKDQWRDEFQNMMKYVRANKTEIDAVCFYAISRLGRNVRLVLETIDELTRMKIAVYSYTEKLDTNTSTGKFTLTILSALAQLESDQIRERVMPNMKYSVENEGRWMGARYVPYGYVSKPMEENNTSKKPRKHLVVVPEQADMLKLIFNLYCDGIGDDINAGQFKIAK